MFVVRNQIDKRILSFFPASGGREGIGLPPRGITITRNRFFGVERKLTFKVRQTKIDVLLDDEPMFTLLDYVKIKPADETGLRLGSWQNKTIFHSLIVEPVD